MIEFMLTCYLTGLASSILLARATWKEQNFWWRMLYGIATTCNVLLVAAVTTFYLLFKDVN